MKYLNIVLASLVLFYLVLTGVIVNHVFLGDALFYPFEGRWDLVWRDEFNGTALNTSHWTAIAQGSGLYHELQAYIDENVTVHDGKLVLACKEEEWTGPDNLHPGQSVTRDYTSAMISTKDKNDWAYGRFEIRAMMPKGKGLTPYFGLFAADNWPPEIGLGMPGGFPRQLFMINHWRKTGKHGQDEAVAKYDRSLSGRFHLYAIEWEPGVIRWRIDGVIRHEVRREVPNRPLYLLIRIPVGGEFSADPESMVAKGEEPAVFPQTMQIDWVRVYKRR